MTYQSLISTTVSVYFCKTWRETLPHSWDALLSCWALNSDSLIWIWHLCQIWKIFLHNTTCWNTTFNIQDIAMALDLQSLMSSSLVNSSLMVHYPGWAWRHCNLNLRPITSKCNFPSEQHEIFKSQTVVVYENKITLKTNLFARVKKKIPLTV